MRAKIGLLLVLGGLCWLGLSSFGISTAAARAADVPYTAYVCVESAEVVAGPGHRYYATDRLPLGTQVEIYREDASGWLAIRPPEGSFSWLPAEFVERLDDSVAKVVEPTGAWIGTTVEHVAEHHQQVMLKVGEVVQVLGEKSVAAKGGETRKWLKIAPPAGEYRWIHLRDVSRQKPVEMPQTLATAEDSTTEELTSRLEKNNTSEPRRLDLPGATIAIHSINDQAARIGTGIKQAQYRSATSNNAPSLSPDGFVPRKRRSGDEGVATTSPARPITSTPAIARPSFDPDARYATSLPARRIEAAPASAPIGGGLSAETIARELDQVDVDLSLMVAQDRSQWNLPALTRRVETLIEQGADPTSRGRARLMLDKIKQFDNKFDSAPSSGSAASVSRPAASPSTPAAGSLADPRYDAQGLLKEVVSRKNAKPAAPYAVVDSEGQPLCFVTPSPGLNLHRYINKQVGVYGRRGYLEELKKPHVIAERVIEVDSRLR